jgi:hypothetical protein
MAKLRKPQSGQESVTPEDRIRWLLDHHWSGNQSQMAADIHCSQSVISRVVRGVQPAGSRLLRAIGDHPEINKIWLLSGDEKPLIIPGSLPISNAILPGPPLQHRDLLEGRYPVIPQDFRESRYWHRIQPNEPAVDSKIAKVRPSDFVLLECDVPWFLSQYPNFSGLAVVRQHEESGEICRLCRIWPERSNLFNVDTFEAASSSSKTRAKAKRVVRQITVLEYWDGTTESRVEPAVRATRDSMPPRGGVRQHPRPSPSRSPTVGVADIVAVSVGLVRETP